MKTWEQVANQVREDFGMFVDWDERFFICPECDEPIYEEDWDKDIILENGYCPVCGAALMPDCETENYYDAEEEEDE